MNAHVPHKAELPFNRAIFRWARERRQMAVEEAAKRIGTTPDKLDAWERGDAVPTVRQARILADVYGRSFLELFRPEPPPLQESDLVPDFRLHRGAPEPREGRDLLDIQAWAEEIRFNALDLYDAIAEPPPLLPAAMRAKLADSPEVASLRAREAIEYDFAAQIGLNSRDRPNAPAAFRRAIEAAGVLVLRQSALAKFRARGLCIYAEPLPVIVYSSEAPSAQMFTLAHELGHIALGESAISGAPPPQGAPSHGRTVEQWCNRFAAALLVPATDLAAQLAKPNEPEVEIGDDHLAILAKRYAISPHAMLIRLIELRYVSADFYWQKKRDELLKQEADFKGGGRPDYYGSRYRSARGDHYTGLVIEAWSTGKITNHSASEFMGIKNIRHLMDIRDHFGT